jgi:hypothetical protein
MQPILLLLVKVSVVERIPTILYLYGRRNLHLLVPANDYSTCKKMHVHCHSEHFFRNGSYFMGERPDVSPNWCGWHTSLARFVSKHNGFNILFMHADMYVDLNRIAHYPETEFWLPFNTMRTGPTGGWLSGSKCAPLDKLNDDNEWGWWGIPPVGIDWTAGHGKSLCKRIMESFDSKYCCYGWVDMVHIPSWSTSLFVHFLEHFSDSHCEIAVPSSIYLINKFRVLFAQCLGSCCETVDWPTAKNATCAHRIDLQDVQQRLSTYLLNSS